MTRARIPTWLPRGARLDALAAAVLAAATQLELWTNESVEPPMALQVPAFLAMTLPIAWRRRYPLLAAAVVSAGLAAQELLAGEAPVVGGFLGIIVTTYSLGRYAGGSRLAVGIGLILLTFAAGYADPAQRSFADLVGNLVIVGVLVGLGRAVGLWSDRAGALAARAERAEREREEAVQAAAEEERARIARELHDLVGHNVSVMTLQAGAARQVLDAAPERARESLLAVEEQGRQAVSEMRRLLGLLRSGLGEPELTPQPGVASIGALVEQVREAGLPVEFRVEGEPQPVPPGLGLSAYRIVQEALTNVVKHADNARAEVVVRYSADELALEVLDEGRRTSPADAGGHGLVGMRQRVALYGGTLEAGPRAEGGFAVRARLPLAASA